MSSPPSRVSRSIFDSSTASKQRHRSSGGGRSSSRTHSHSTAADTSQQEFVCVYCPEKVAWDGSNRYFFATEADYRLHLATRHRLIIDETEELRQYLNSQRNESVILLKYLCVICDQTFTEPLEWEEHRQEVHNEEPMDQSFSSIVKEKRSHKRHSHPVKKEEPVEPMDQQQNDDSVFFMDNADVASTSVAVVVADQPKENAPKKNLCEYCGKGFVTEKSMAEHLSTKHLRDIMIKSETEK